MHTAVFVKIQQALQICVEWKGVTRNLVQLSFVVILAGATHVGAEESSAIAVQGNVELTAPQQPGVQSAKAVDVAPFVRTENRLPCADYHTLRRPFFGDLHVHTAWSFDAHAQGTRNSPSDAYDFARGLPLEMQPYGDDGLGRREVRNDRPLDFAAVTDHSEFFGEMRLCSTTGASGYYHPICLLQRNMPQLTQLAFGGMGLTVKRRWGFCGKDNTNCLESAEQTWRKIRDYAEQASDRSTNCEFTSFVGYEWTATVGRGTNLHHNVIFRNSHVPDHALSWIESPTQMALWDYLEHDCVRDLPGCDAIAIPHNSNLSRGLMFASPMVADKELPIEPVETALAKRRAHWNPLFEIMQHKGASECDVRLRAWQADEFCDFELLPYDTFGTKNTGEDGEGLLYWLKQLFGGEEFDNPKPPGVNSYLRHALLQGVKQQHELQANSFKFGLIGSTDTHIAAPGLVSEYKFPGHGGEQFKNFNSTSLRFTDELEFNPGGLAVLYAEENSRDALFAAMRRREAYATSGTRPMLRFFGGWDIPHDACERANQIALGYAHGVPMGSDLPPAQNPDEQRAPRFLISAQADTGSTERPGTALQRIQVIKGWYDGEVLRERVIDVAGGDNDAQVDTRNCEQRGSGHRALCTVWSDETFSADEQAFYYVRLLENPSCRWSQRLCVAARVNCSDPTTIPSSLDNCCSVDHHQTIQERAWSSPIWYSPPAT